MTIKQSSQLLVKIADLKRNFLLIARAFYAVAIIKTK